MEGISIFANISVGTNTATTLSEVDEYLNRPVKNVLDPLKLSLPRLEATKTTKLCRVELRPMRLRMPLSSKLHTSQVP